MRFGSTARVLAKCELTTESQGAQPVQAGTQDPLTQDAAIGCHAQLVPPLRPRTSHIRRLMQNAAGLCRNSTKPLTQDAACANRYLVKIPLLQRELPSSKAGSRHPRQMAVCTSIQEGVPSLLGQLACAAIRSRSRCMQSSLHMQQSVGRSMHRQLEARWNLSHVEFSRTQRTDRMRAKPARSGKGDGWGALTFTLCITYRCSPLG